MADRVLLDEDLRERDFSKLHHGSGKAGTPPYRTLKLPLNVVVRSNDTQSALREVSERATRISFRALLTVRLYLLKLFHNGYSMPEINQNFMLAAFRAVCKRPSKGSAAKRARDLTNFLRQFYESELQPTNEAHQTDQQLGSEHFDQNFHYLANDLVQVIQYKCCAALR